MRGVLIILCLTNVTCATVLAMIDPFLSSLDLHVEVWIPSASQRVCLHWKLGRRSQRLRCFNVLSGELTCPHARSITNSYDYHLAHTRVWMPKSSLSFSWCHGPCTQSQARGLLGMSATQGRL